MIKRKYINEQSRALLIAEILMEKRREGVWEGQDSVIKSRGNRSFNVATMKGIKKMVKYLYLEEFPVRKERKPKCLVNEWYRTDESGETNVYVGFFKKTEKTMQAIERYIDLEADVNYYDYSPTGKWFGNEADVYETENRIVVVKTWVLDC